MRIHEYSVHHNGDKTGMVAARHSRSDDENLRRVAPSRTPRSRARQRWRTWSVAALVVACLASGIALLMRTGADAESPAVKHPLAVATVVIDRVSSYQMLRSHTGTVAAGRHTELSFQRAGKVETLAADDGDSVEAGQTLARLETNHLEAKQRELQAQREQAAAVLQELVAGPRKETIAASRAEVCDLQAQLELLQANHRRRKALHQRKVVTQEEYEHSLFEMKAAAARLEAARRRLDELVAGTRKERIAAQRALVSQLDATLEDLAIDIADSTLTAPFPGKIARRYIDEGTVVSTGTSVLRIVESGNLEVRVGIPVSLAADLRVGDPYQVQAGQRQFACTVGAVLPEVDQATRTCVVVFRLADDVARQLVPGQVVRVTMAETVPTSGYWLPTSALTRGGRGLWSVYAVCQDNPEEVTTVQRCHVEVLHTEGERVLVRGILNPGDRIVAGGTHRIVPGQEVMIVSPPRGRERTSLSDSVRRTPRPSIHPNVAETRT